MGLDGVYLRRYDANEQVTEVLTLLSANSSVKPFNILGPVSSPLK